MMLKRRTLLQFGAGAAATLLGSPSAGQGPRGPAQAARNRVRLSDGWRFHLGHAADPRADFGFGLDQRTYAKAGVTSPATLAGFDDADWTFVSAPHDWAVSLPYAPPPADLPKDRADAAAAHGYRAIGRNWPQNSIGWYRLRLPPIGLPSGGRASLEFDGVFRDCLVFVNGYAVKRNESGYAPFAVDITDFLATDGGPNQLTVRVDASLGEGWFYEGAGIYRHVDLVVTGPVHVPQWGVAVRSEVGPTGARVAVVVEIRNTRDAAVRPSIRHRIFAPGGHEVSASDGPAATIEPEQVRVDVETLTVAAPQLWSVEMPHLYTLVTEICEGFSRLDRVETRFGIRSVHFDAQRGFLLNGMPVKLLGTCNHQDHAGVGTAIPDRLHGWRIEQLQSMGSNAWRSAHNPPATAFLDLCDEKGMLVIDEARLNSTSEEATSELERMVRRDRNHPSIILWSVGNEEPQQGTARGAHMSAAMRDRVHALDPSRPVTQAFDQAFGEGATRVVDVVGFNYRTDKIDAFHARFPQVPVIGTETGSTVSTRGAYANETSAHVVRAYDSEHPWWASTAEEWWSIVAERPFIGGGFIWTGFDYRGEPTPFTWPSASSYFGVLDLCGFPKDNYWYYRAQWRREPLVHLLPHWTWPGREGEPVEVWAYTNGEEVELRLNGRALGRKPAPPHGHVAWRVPYAPGRLEARALRDGRVIARTAVETAGRPQALRLEADRMRIRSDGQDVAIVRASVVDDRGRQVPDAAQQIDLSVDGAGRLTGVGNGDPTSREPDHASTRHAFHGLAQAIVQSGRDPGPITIVARATGLRDARATLLALPI